MEISDTHTPDVHEVVAELSKDTILRLADVCKVALTVIKMKEINERENNADLGSLIPTKGRYKGVAQ